MASSDTLAAASRPLPLHMRGDLVFQPQWFAGRKQVAVKDPVALRYYHLGEEEYFILQRLDGGRSIADLQAEFEREFAPRKLQASSLHGFLSMLHREGLVISNAVGQGEQLRERGAKTRRRQRRFAWLNPLAVRFQGVDPDRLLTWLHPRVAWLFSPPALIFSLLWVAAAVAWLVVHFREFQTRLPEAEAFFHPANLVWFALAMALAKVVHELAHGLACKHFGGECHELGVMLLVFTPCLYVNVSDSWMLSDKWKRIAISAAGMWAEMVLAATCVCVWWFTAPGLLNSLCLQLMFLSSLATVLFNINPLLPFDGYYILSDLIEAPNLRQRAFDRLRRELSAWFLGWETPGERLVFERERARLLTYAVLAIVYRLCLIAGILWFCHEVLKAYGLQAIAHLLTVLVVAGLLVPPLLTLGRLLRNPDWRRRVKTTRVLVRGLLVVGCVCLLLWIPLPYRVSAPVVLEFRDARRVFVTTPGILQSAVESGTAIRQGQSLGRLVNLSLQEEILSLEGRRDVLETQLAGLRRRSAQQTNRGVADVGSQIPLTEAALNDVRERLARREHQQRELDLRAPLAGIVIPPPRRKDQATRGSLSEWNGHPLEIANRGAYLSKGTIFCQVGDPAQLKASLLVDQADLPRLEIGQRVFLQLDQLPGVYPCGRLVELSEADLDSIPTELIAAGRLALRHEVDGTPLLAGTYYLATVELPEPSPALVAGGVGRARIVCDPKTLAWRIAAYLHRTFRLRSG